MPLIFSYGTLQKENVQIATFGRKLGGHRDQLVGYEETFVPIADPEIVAKTGMSHNKNVVFNGSDTSRIEGAVFEITDTELQYVDRYEDASKYKRIAVTLASGKQAWVYVDASGAD
jgi:gamma-glutamylcyclotransferase (GGCT)/AIG2-like uncharacterized protein YtfP